MKKILQIATVRGGKALITIWLLILVILIGIPVISFFQGELLGGVAFSILPAAILLNISIVIASIIKHDSPQIAKIGWVTLCIAEIIFVLVVADPQHPDAFRDAGIILGYAMFALSFPLGFIGPLLLWAGGSLLSYVFGLFGRADLLVLEGMKFYISNFFLWLSFFITGYLQWFKLLPFLIEKWQTRKSRISPM